MKEVNRVFTFVLTSALMIAASISLSTAANAGTSKIGVIVFDGVLTSDVTAPIEVFGEASAQSWFSKYEVITIAASKDHLIRSEQGLTIKADKLIADSPEVDVLIVPSAYNMKPLINNKELINYIQKAAKEVKWLSSNCSGAQLLAEAGVLDGKKATTWAGGEKELKDNYPKVDVQYDVNYVIDGNILTSNGSLVSYEAALAILAKISSDQKAQSIKEALQMQRIQH